MDMQEIMNSRDNKVKYLNSAINEREADLTNTRRRLLTLDRQDYMRGRTLDMIQQLEELLQLMYAALDFVSRQPEVK